MDFEKMLGINQLDLSYEVHAEGFDGENFTYSIYFDDEDLDAKKPEVDDAINEAFSDEEDDYMGYVDINIEDGKIFIYHDLGNVAPEKNDVAIQKMLKAIDKVSDVREVIINEGSGFDF